MKSITSKEILVEYARMGVEQAVTGRFLISTESEGFWKDMKLLAKNKPPKYNMALLKTAENLIAERRGLV